MSGKSPVTYNGQNVIDNVLHDSYIVCAFDARSARQAFNAEYPEIDAESVEIVAPRHPLIPPTFYANIPRG